MHILKQCIVYRETKNSGIILMSWATFVPISAFLLFVVSTVARGEECALFRLFQPILRVFFANFAAIKKTFPK